jgi:hypothetical protein
LYGFVLQCIIAREWNQRRCYYRAIVT